MSEVLPAQNPPPREIKRKTINVVKKIVKVTQLKEVKF